ncbi:Mak10 subunit, NatC N-terminal acetyltransferase-domain-containing protein [Lipomyces arxii]|uniref:Mak10 subunit, NatC N-terminal acetyltransferase-domain-containing protein n=1 Tax=Lipomyces arxii TaxID=56418 RepID=UPI0034CF63F5
MASVETDTKLLSRLSIDRPPVEIPPVAPNYVDVTDLFRAEAQKIQPSELVMMETFELVNSINALEIMDAKMDTGLLDLQSQDWEFDARANRTAEQIIGIMDELFCMQMSWHTGGALCQSVFTCLYVEQALTNYNGTIASAHFGTSATDLPELDWTMHENVFVHSTLRAYVIAIVKACDFVNKRLPCNEIMADEDIVMQTYGLDMLQFVNAEDTCTLLDNAIEDLARLKAEAKSAAEKTCIDALDTRLQFCKMQVQALDAADDTPERQNELLSEFPNLLVRIIETHALAVPVPSAFSIAIQGRLECGMPPRPMAKINFSDAITTCRSLFDGILDVLKIQKYDSIGEIIVYFERFAMRRPTELPYVRCQLFKRFLVGGEVVGQHPLRELTEADIVDISCPLPALFAIPMDHICRPDFDEFMNRATGCLQTYMSVLCRNKSRLRQGLCRALLDWDSLQVDSENLESRPEMIEFSPMISAGPDGGEYMQSLPLSSWVYTRKLQIMLQIVYTGFELDIYRLEEWSVVYGHAIYLLQAYSSHLQRTYAAVEATVSASKNSGSKAKKSKRRKNADASGPRPDLEAASKSFAWCDSMMMLAKVYRKLSQGYVSIAKALVAGGVLREFGVTRLSESGGQDYSSGELMYKLRMKPYSTIGVPEVLSYASFVRMNNVEGLKVEELLGSAQVAIQDARCLIDTMSKQEQVNAGLVQYENTQALQQLTRSCIGTGVAISMLQRLKLQESSKTENQTRIKITIQKDKFHPYFPVLSVLERK